MSGKHTFTACLVNRVVKKKFELIELIADKDELLYDIGPELREKYMQKFGDLEQEVIEAEINVDLAKKFYEKLRAAANRREKINIDKLKAELETEKSEKLTQLEKSDITNVKKTELNSIQKEEFNVKYKTLLKRLHPALNPDQSESEKELYSKLTEAYKQNDLEAMDLIQETIGGIEGFLRKNVEQSPFDVSYEFDSDIDSYPGNDKFQYTDYTLTDKICDCFIADINEYETILEADNLDKQIKEANEEIAKIKSAFPFTAQDMLSSENGSDDYMIDLRARLRAANESLKFCQIKINEITGDVTGA